MMQKERDLIEEMHPVMVQDLIYPCCNCKKLYSFFGIISQDFSNSIDIHCMVNNYIKVDGQVHLKENPSKIEDYDMMPIYRVLVEELKAEGFENFGIDILNEENK